MARTLLPAGVTGLEAATAAQGSVVIEGSHRDSGCDGGGVGTGHGHSPDRHGVGPCAAVKVFGSAEVRLLLEARRRTAVRNRNAGITPRALFNEHYHRIPKMSTINFGFR